MSKMFLKDLMDDLRLAIAAYDAQIAELRGLRAQLVELIEWKPSQSLARSAAAQTELFEETPAAMYVDDSAARKKRNLSPEARARISAAQKARWERDRGRIAEPHASAQLSINAGGAQKKRKHSPEGRARISAAQKARWARDRKRTESDVPETSAAAPATLQFKAKLIKKAAV